MLFHRWQNCTSQLICARMLSMVYRVRLPKCWEGKMALPTDLASSTAAFYDTDTLDPDSVRDRVDEMAARFTWSREQLLDYQQSRLREMLRHAADASPYFRD